MRETWVQSLDWEGPLEKGKATRFSILAWRLPWGRKESDTTEQLRHVQEVTLAIFQLKKSFKIWLFPSCLL